MRKVIIFAILMASNVIYGQTNLKTHETSFKEAVKEYLVEKEMEMPNDITQKLFLEFDSGVKKISLNNEFLINKIYDQKNVNFLVNEYLSQFEELNEIEPIVKSFRTFEILTSQLVNKDFDFEKATGEKAFGLLDDFMSDYANLLIQIDPKNPVEIFLNNEKIQLNNPLPKLYFDIVVHAGKAYDVKIKKGKNVYEQKGIKLKSEEKKLIKYKL